MPSRPASRLPESAQRALRSSRCIGPGRAWPACAAVLPLDAGQQSEHEGSGRGTRLHALLITCRWSRHLPRCPSLTGRSGSSRARFASVGSPRPVIPGKRSDDRRGAA
jgi:hypothetical protein